MSPQNTERLYQAFPRLYRGRDKPFNQSNMPWGFCCYDGWFDLVWCLSEAIERRAHALDLNPTSEDWPEADQVKEKLGTLRFYLKPPLQPYSDLTNEAMLLSKHICEQCGKLNIKL